MNVFLRSEEMNVIDRQTFERNHTHQFTCGCCHVSASFQGDEPNVQGSLVAAWLVATENGWTITRYPRRALICPTCVRRKLRALDAAE